MKRGPLFSDNFIFLHQYECLLRTSLALRRPVLDCRSHMPRAMSLPSAVYWNETERLSSWSANP
jgi:hypothetical protein